MPRFFYRAKSGPDEIKEGIVEAESQRAAIYKIGRMGYFPIEVQEEMASKPFANAGAGVLFSFGKNITSRDLAVLTRQLSDLLSSGVAILKSIEILSKQASIPRLRMVIEDIHTFVKEGGTLSDGLARHPKIFSNLYVSMVKAGETAGLLEEVLNRLADYAEVEDQLANKVRSALVYPALMSFVGMATIIVLLTFVIPRLVTIFDDMGQALPVPTLILIKISAFMTHYGWILLVVIVFFSFIIKRRGKTKEGRFFFDNFKLKIFAIGQLIKKTDIARFTRTLSVLLSNGVSMIQSLDVSSSVVENAAIRRRLQELSREVSEGVSFSKAISKVPVFPLFAMNMVAVGDESGHLEKALLKVAESCERDVDRSIRMFTSMLEPVVILFMGSVVGFIVISMLLPIFQINLAVR